MKPSTSTITEILGRMLRRLKAKDISRAARECGQSPPQKVFDDLVATTGVELEAEFLLSLLKADAKKGRTK